MEIRNRSGTAVTLLVLERQDFLAFITSQECRISGSKVQAFLCGNSVGMRFSYSVISLLVYLLVLPQVSINADLMMPFAL